MCDSNNMTEKTKACINDATDLAEEACNTQLEPIHLATVLFDENNLGGRVCKKVSKDTDNLSTIHPQISLVFYSFTPACCSWGQTSFSCLRV